MKKFTLLFIVLISLTIRINAQIPNNGFENWTTVETYQNPDGWGTMNNTTALLSVFTATKGTPGSTGASYLKLVSKTVNSVVVNGIAVSGKIDSLTQLPISGFAFDQRPQSFTGSWQHMIFGSSAGSVTATLTRWNSVSSQREIVAVATQALSGMVMSWTAFSLNFVYQSGNYPDTCIIVLKASGATPTANDYLYVDNLAFSGSVASIIENNVSENNFNIYPCPASTNFILNFDKKNNDALMLNIYNTIGVLVKTEIIGQNKKQIDVAELSSGIYIIEVRSNNWSAKKKLIIN